MKLSFARFAPALLAALALAVPAVAAAQAWTGAGAPVCTATGQQYQTRVASDGSGGVYVGWTDQRPGTSTSDIYVAHIGADGAPAPGWPADGLAVCAATGAQLLYAIAPDGAGGVYLAWEDYRNGVFADIYGQHLLADGQLATGWPADGLGIAVFMDEQRDPDLVPDGNGGVFCIWADARTYAFSQRDVYAQHLLGDGTPATGWAANGMRVTNARSYDYQPQAAADPDGGLYVTWTRNLSDQDIGAQHLDATGVPYATWPDTGIVLCAAPNDQTAPTVVPGAGGTAMAVWKDLRYFSTPNPEADFFGARFGPDTSRVGGWPHEGMQLYASTNGISAPFVVSDGGGGALFMWGELVTPTNEDLFVMHLNSAGVFVSSPAFLDGIVPVCQNAEYQHPVSIVPDGAGGAFAGWVDYRDAGPSFTNPDPYIQHIAADATIASGWPAGGVALTQETTPESETLPVAVPGGVVAVFTRGSGSGADLYVSMVGLDGVVPALVSLVSSEASPGRVRIAWLVAGDAGEEWRIERRDEGSDWREIARARPDGLGQVALDDDAVTPGARYGYRLAPLAGGVALGETWIDVPRAAPAFALRGAWPNPVTREARVRFALPAAGDATLTLVDAQGRARRRWDLRADVGEQELALGDLGRLAPGVYWLRLQQGPRTATTRIAVVR